MSDLINPAARLTLVIALFPGVTQLDFTGPHQVLCRAPDADLVTASMGGADIAAEGLTFSGLMDLTKIERCDLLLVPGGAGVGEAMLDGAFLREMRRLGAGAKWVTSVCTGSLILAAAGFLTGRRAACHWAWRDLLVPFGVIVDEGRVVRDGDLITGGGVTAGLDFAFTVLAELAGDTYAQAVQLGLEYAPQPPFDAGRPESAPPAVLEAYLARMAPLGPARLAAAEAAAGRLRAAAA